MLVPTCIIVLLVVSSNALFFQRQHPWNGLKVTFGLHGFNDMPREESQAKSQGFTMISDCNANPKFHGKRYIKDNDSAVILLYDRNGYIAGIQAGVNIFHCDYTKHLGEVCPNIEKAGFTLEYKIASDPQHSYPSTFLKGHPLIADGNMYYITAYFVDPADICTTGRTFHQFQTEGTGTDLYIQNGSDPVHDSMKIPRQENNLTSTHWTLGHCFPAMGVHYWYNIRKDMSCDEFYPVFLLYNGGVLNAFGWAFNLNVPSTRVEHPPKPTLKQFMNPVPDCLYTAEILSTLHIYLSSNPQTDIFCN